MARPDILLLCGSRSRPSYTFSLACAVATALDRGGARVRLLDLAEAELPLGDAGGKRSGRAEAAVRELESRVQAADAVVLASPVYHNSYSGLLKLALDLLDPTPFEGKPVGLVSHGNHRSPQAVDHLRIVARGLGAVAIPTQLCTAQADYAAAPAGDGVYPITATEIRERIARFAAELLRFAVLLRGGTPMPLSEREPAR